MMDLVYSENRDRQESTELPDKELALRARGGDMVAFEVLVTRKTPAVVSVARRIVGDAEDARDVAQLVFLRVWEQLARYDDQYSFNTWLYRIATNLSIDFLRSSRSRERAHGATLHLIRMREEMTGHETTNALEDAELARLFQTVSGRLTGKQKAVFVLKEMEDCDTKEIARILKCGESTVRNHLFNARRILRREIARICPGLIAGRGRR
jgi:RNA polymerase sigma-70 factor, ECF subfamily